MIVAYFLLVFLQLLSLHLPRFLSIALGVDLAKSPLLISRHVSSDKSKDIHTIEAFPVFPVKASF
jgi:hypothetical protein